MFSLRRKYSMKKWKSDTPHKLQEGGDPNAIVAAEAAGAVGGPTADPNAAGVGAGNAAISAMGNVEEPAGGDLNAAVGMAKGMGIKKKGGIAPGKFLRQGGATGRKLL